jgi:hypothetical protein
MSGLGDKEVPFYSEKIEWKMPGAVFDGSGRRKPQPYKRTYALTHLRIYALDLWQSMATGWPLV